MMMTNEQQLIEKYRGAALRFWFEPESSYEMEFESYEEFYEYLFKDISLCPKGMSRESYIVARCYYIFEYEVAVERDRRDLEQRLDDRQPEREVGDEVVVHDVDVRPVGVGDPLQLPLEVGEVGGQDRGADLQVRLRHAAHPSCGRSAAPQQGDEHHDRGHEGAHGPRR